MNNLMIILIAVIAAIISLYFIKKRKMKVKYTYKEEFNEPKIHKKIKNIIKEGTKEKLNQNFYDYKKIYPELEILKENKEIILKEVEKINKIQWTDWPEKHLYKSEDGKMSWKVFPFMGFDDWALPNCELCPNLTKILKKIPNLMTASLSKLKPGTELTPHQGWAKLSNNVLRCHYGIIVPSGCYIFVDGENQKMKTNEIIVFDDSKIHSASNYGNEDRIVLIIDIKRPPYVKRGESKYSNVTELDNFVNYFKELNKKN